MGTGMGMGMECDGVRMRVWGLVANVWHISAFKEDCICYACVAPLRFSGNRSRVNISVGAVPCQRKVFEFSQSEWVQPYITQVSQSRTLFAFCICLLPHACVCGNFLVMGGTRMQNANGAISCSLTAHFPFSYIQWIPLLLLCHAMLHEICSGQARRTFTFSQQLSYLGSFCLCWH